MISRTTSRMTPRTPAAPARSPRWRRPRPGSRTPSRRRRSALSARTGSEAAGLPGPRRERRRSGVRTVLLPGTPVRRAEPPGRTWRPLHGGGRSPGCETPDRPRPPVAEAASAGRRRQWLPRVFGSAPRAAAPGSAASLGSGPRGRPIRSDTGGCRIARPVFLRRVSESAATRFAFPETGGRRPRMTSRTTSRTTPRTTDSDPARAARRRPRSRRRSPAPTAAPAGRNRRETP